MTDIKRKWDLLPKERRAELVKEIITYFKTEQDQEIGVVAAEDILDFFLDAFGEDIYNKAVHDAKATIKQSFENLEVDVDALIQK